MRTRFASRLTPPFTPHKVGVSPRNNLCLILHLHCKVTLSMDHVGWWDVYTTAKLSSNFKQNYTPPSFGEFSTSTASHWSSLHRISVVLTYALYSITTVHVGSFVIGHFIKGSTSATADRWLLLSYISRKRPVWYGNILTNMDIRRSTPRYQETTTLRRNSESRRISHVKHISQYVWLHSLVLPWA